MASWAVRGSPILLAGAIGLVPAPAAAHSGGVAGGECTGCHNSGNQTLSLTTTPATISPGATVTVRLTVNGSGAETGVFIMVDAGSLDTVSGQGLSSVGAGLTHSSPRPMSGGQATMEFEYTAPQSPGAVRFEVFNVVANGNNASSGDGAAEAAFDFVYGCQGQPYYRDHDGDGYGRNSQERLQCVGADPAGYAPQGDDCDDNRETVYPGATEYCNTRDDDCDGEVDEDALPVEQYPDGDGDGYYGASEAQSEDTFLGCVPTDGYAAEGGDCVPDDATIHPDAEEVCNLVDDNCDNRVDEGVRPTCGEGWCRRNAQTCDASTCYPGPAAEESCNFIDDDCNGIVDDGDLCDAGQQCVAGECQEIDDGPVGGSTGGGSGATAGGTTSTGTDGAGQVDPTGSGSSSGCAVDPGPRGPTAWLWLALLAFNRGRRRSPRRGRRGLRGRRRPERVRR